jgi:hypothetical protein
MHPLRAVVFALVFWPCIIMAAWCFILDDIIRRHNGLNNIRSIELEKEGAP